MRPAGIAPVRLGGGLGWPGLGAAASTWGPTTDDRRGGMPRPDPGRCSHRASFARAGAGSRPRPPGPSCEPNSHRPHLPQPWLPVVRSWPHVTTWTWDKIMTLWSSFIRVSMRLTENIIALTTVHMPCVYTHVSAVINSGTYTHTDTHSELSQCYHIPQHLHRIRNRHTPHLHIRAHAGHTAYATF